MIMVVMIVFVVSIGSSGLCLVSWWLLLWVVGCFVGGVLVVVILLFV